MRGDGSRVPRLLGALMTFVAGALVAVLAGAALVWSGQVVLDDPSAPVEAKAEEAEAETLTATVEKGSTELKLDRQGTMAYPVARSISVEASGTVTRVDHTSGTPLDENQPIVHVDEVPVVLARGDLPLYRTLEVGVVGDDVVQLQDFLDRQGFWRWRHDGRYTTDVGEAVKHWQRSIHAPETGTVTAERFAFVPGLPAVATIPAEVVVGAKLSGKVVDLSGTTPVVSLTMDEMEATTLEVPAPVEVEGGDAPIPGTLTRLDPPSEANGWMVDGKIELDAQACAAQCSALYASSGGQVSVSIIVQERIDGLVVPPAAVQEEADGTQFVVMDSTGRRQPVEVLGTSPNALVVKGVEEGDVVRIPT